MNPDNIQPQRSDVQPQQPQQPPPPPQQQYQVSPAQDPGHGLGIASLVLSFFIAPLGLILGIIGLSTSKKAGFKNGLALAGTIIGSIGVVVITIAVIVMVSSLSTIVNECNRLGPGKHQVGMVTYTCGSDATNP